MVGHLCSTHEDLSSTSSTRKGRVGGGGRRKEIFTFVSRSQRQRWSFLRSFTFISPLQKYARNPFNSFLCSLELDRCLARLPPGHTASLLTFLTFLSNLPTSLRYHSLPPPCSHLHTSLERHFRGFKFFFFFFFNRVWFFQDLYQALLSCYLVLVSIVVSTCKGELSLQAGWAPQQEWIPSKGILFCLVVKLKPLLSRKRNQIT